MLVVQFGVMLTRRQIQEVISMKAISASTKVGTFVFYFSNAKRSNVTFNVG